MNPFHKQTQKSYWHIKTYRPIWWHAIRPPSEAACDHTVHECNKSYFIKGIGHAWLPNTRIFTGCLRSLMAHIMHTINSLWTILVRQISMTLNEKQLEFKHFNSFKSLIARTQWKLSMALCHIVNITLPVDITLFHRQTSQANRTTKVQYTLLNNCEILWQTVGVKVTDLKI